MNISIKKIEKSKVDTIDFNNIPLGTSFTDHMFICDYKDGEWQNPRIEPLALIPTHPAAMALHYGQAIFEGMKANVDEDGTPMLFRADKNAARLNFSADRMGMPNVPEELFVEGLKQLVAMDKAWIPPQDGSALYLRPFMYADEAFIGMRAATSYKFIIMASPAGPFFSKRIKLWAEKKFVRAVDGGTGEAKAAGNYAAAIRPTELAKAKGYDQVLWLDAVEHEYIQEVGTMNIFFKIDGKFITPRRDGAILDGITRMSVIDILKDKGFEVIERPITLTEIREASEKGLLEEAFGTGTAVGIAYIQSIGTENGDIHVSDESPVGLEVNDMLNAIKTGKIEDKFNWMIKVEKELV
ncbi:branched chain amino acid aminotransferase [Meridianimaribacter sp. CL38]|uniref:Branched-chain-amino-acid aminotransferase n=2 Tax=Flavobacteriaceae TaxID=49546 RepID=A0ABY2G3H0_9FLAO|nr:MULTISPECIES: branched-chain amino acid aminotransferase [Meridianimaribacter]TBV25006.1 branched chain amino acid aminotransferase [Meridianimaribacter sp. CL38]TDY10176.1 branched-chain amino acid aminotransferase [Meridianimaribacter flavus]